MVRKLGILIDRIETSQLILDMNVSIGEAISKQLYDDVNVFYNNVGQNMMASPCAYMSPAQLHGFNGEIIATNIATAEVALNISKNRRFFYIWELEWLKEGVIPHYDSIAPYYNNNEFIYATRSKSYAAILENNFNTKVEIITPNFNLEKFNEYSLRCGG